jgi:cytochrome c biogenesis protein CcmG/thiol:disulfide interchange protein DsbE
MSEERDMAEEPRPQRPRRWRGLALALVPVLAFTALLASGLGKDARRIPDALGGSAAPDFALQALDDGRVIRMRELRGHVVVINFWASWCAECYVEHPDLLAAWRRYGDAGVVFLGVLYQDGEDGARDYVRQMGGDWPILVDPGSRVALDYGVAGVPETYVVGPDGIVATKRVGAVTGGFLTRWIDRLLRTSDGQAAEP